MKRLAAIAMVILSLATAGLADLATSKHNLSTSGPGTMKASAENETCVFCHTPHNANPAVPLWNHQASTATYTPYNSTTLKASRPGQPGGSSRLCLACHDGTVALGQTVNDGLISMNGVDAGGRMPAGSSSNLGTSLADDHPVSFQRGAGDTQTVDPPPGDAVKLDASGQVQCTSCHDPHEEARDTTTRKFLVKSNQSSALCTTCHHVDGWATNPSSHQSSSKAYGPAQGAHTGYTTVRDNGCESCHRPHTGRTPERLLKFVEEATCNPCHSGTVASKNVASDFQKSYVHPTYSTTPSVHDAAEAPTNALDPLPETSPAAARHAECADCHDAHASYSRAASPPNVPGSLAGVSGVDSGGTGVKPAAREYEVCYKCHGDSANKPQERGLPYPPYTARQLVQYDVRLEFDPLNPSHHAVEGPGRSADVPSLVAPYTTSSVIYCSDCHASDTGPGAGGTGARGPHGSIYNHLLERNASPGNNSGSNYTFLYALCFKCHSQTSIFSDVTFKEHSKHVRGEGASCLVCHDPHGVSGTQGNTTNNARLINFDTTIVHPDSQGRLRFEVRGTRRGACYLTCHGEQHDGWTY